MTTKEFFDKYNGRGIDWDNFYGYQCVDLYRQYCHEVLKLPQSPGVGGAKEIWKTYLKEHFTAIKNDPNAVPELGDIIVWDGFSGNTYGHVGIFVSGDVNNFTSFDQNWPIGSLCHYQPHNYDYVLGWLRPKSTPPPSVTCEFNDQTIIPIGGEWGNMELQAVRSTLNDQKRTVDDLNQKLKECEEKASNHVCNEFDNKLAKMLYDLAVAIEGK